MSLLMSLNQQLFRAFDLIRGTVSSQDYDVILFIVSLFKDGIINTENLKHNAFNFESILYGNKVDSRFKVEVYSEILPIYKESLSRIGSRRILMLLDLFVQFDHDELVKHFPVIFDNLLYTIFESYGKSYGKFGDEAIQPKELSQFMCDLVNLPKGASVYNPFAGLASLNIFLPQFINYIGQEINERSWALGKLRLIAHGKSQNVEYCKEDSISCWPNPQKKFDLIISTPPFEVSMNSFPYDELNNFNAIEQLLVSRGIDSLTDSGKLIVLVPTHFLYLGGFYCRIRENLIERGALEMVISLPSGLFQNTSIPVALLVLNKYQAKGQDVKFVDAKDYLIPNGSNDRILDSDRLLSDIELNERSSNIVSVGIESIRENKYNLNVGRYFKIPIEGVKLREILTLVKGSRKDLPEQGKLIIIRDLKDDKLSFNLNLAEVEDKNLTRQNIRSIEESCLLLAVRWNSLKPTFFHYKGKGIYLNSDILSFQINTDVVFPEFLINEFHSEYVSNQIALFREGDTIPMIQRDDLLEVVIKLPSLEEQRAKVQGIKELSKRIHELEKEINDLAHGRSISEFNEFASFKHTLGRPRQNILDWTDNLISYLEDNSIGLQRLNNGFKEFYEVDILTALKEIKRDVNFITEVLEKGENGLVLANYSKELIALSDINKLINEISSNGYNFKIVAQPLKGKDLQSRGIVANKILLKTLADNILTNAHKYGFDKLVEGNQVVIELSEVDDNLQVEFRNNGKSFPKNYDQQKFVMKYSTADQENGSGLGGYDIHRIATKFQNPDWILILNEDPIFPVKFKFQFPIVLKN